MAFVNDEILEVRLQPVRGPAFFDGPPPGPARDRDTAQSDSGESGAAADQDVGARDHVRLHDAVAIPLVLPEQLAVGRVDADRAVSVQQEDLRDAVDLREVW